MTTTIDGDSAVIGPTSIDDTDSPYTTQGEQYIEVDTSNGAVTITLASADAVNGREIRIIDTGENASTNNITINTEGSENINPGTNSSITLTLDGTYVDLFSFGTNWFSDRATEKQTAAIGSLASSVDAQGNDLNSVGAANIDDTTIGNSWNDAIVAYPGEKTIQQAFNEASDGDTIIIAGDHTENSIQMVDTEMDVYWLGSVENTATDGSHTFEHPGSLSVMRQRWFNPEIIGNSSSGGGIVTVDDVGTGDATANAPNQFALINPTIKDHGGYGVWWAAPVGCYIGGNLSGATIRDNGDSESTAKTNIRIERGAVNCMIESIFVEHVGSSPIRNLWWTEPRGCVIRNIDWFSNDYDMYIEGARDTQIDGFQWFERAGTADIHWGTSANIGVSGMQTSQSLQTGTVAWQGGVEFESTSGIGKTVRWMDPQTLDNTSNVSETYVQGYLPEQTVDPAFPLFDDSYMWVRSDTSPPELRILDSSGTTTSISLDGTTK